MPWYKVEEYPMENDYILEIKDLSFKYPDYPGYTSPLLLDSLNMSVERGSVSLVVGRPDSGKTSLSRIVAGLLPRFSGGSIGGEVFVDKREVLHSKPQELIELIGLTFQNPEEQLLTARCDTEVAFPLESIGTKRETILQRVEEALEQVGLRDFRERTPSSLSGGEKKRLLIAVLIAVNPELWILDEIFEELDPWFRKRLAKIIRSYHRSVIVLASKWMEIYGEICGSFYLLKGGKIHFCGNSAKDFKDVLEEEGIILSNLEKSTGTNVSVPAEKKRVLEMRDIVFRYGKDERNESSKEDFELAVSRFTIFRGEVVSLVGRNGSGKTTLPKIICGLLEPEEGEIRIFSDEGKDFVGGREILNRTSGYLFQNPDFQIFLPTIADELSLGLKLMNKSEEEINDSIGRAIELFRLPPPETPPTIMGYGTKRRLQAAVYYLLDRRIIIMDEVDSGLSMDELVEILKLFKGKGMGIILITHDIHFASAVSEKVFYMEAGGITKVYEGKSEIGSLMEDIL